MVGAAVACGLAWHGAKVVALDGGDGDFRASRANFGLVWLQGKGLGQPAYQRLTGRSVEAWSDLAARVGEISGIDVHFQRRGKMFDQRPPRCIFRQGQRDDQPGGQAAGQRV